MSDALLQLLQATHDPSEKAAVIAESILNELPEVTSLAARRCIILHWFDLPIVTALLQDIQLTESQIREAYDQLISLPFIESLTWGSTFQDLTREGLLKHYTVKWPELLRFAASLAAPVYANRKTDEAAAGETLFCYFVAGDSQASRTLFNQLLAQAIDHKDWRHGENVLQLQEEAEQLPFVEPLPPTEQDSLIRGLFHTVHGKLETAITDYSRVIEINSNNTMAYINRGNVYTEQQLYEKALSDYNSALQIDPTVFQAYIDRGVIYTKQEHYTEALLDFEHALQLSPRSIFALRNKCLVLCRFGRYEEAEAVYKQILQLDPIVFTVGRSHIFPAQLNPLSQQKAAQEDTALLPLVDLSHVSTFAQTSPLSTYQQLREQRATEGNKESANISNWGPVTPFPPVLQDRGPFPKNGEKKRENTSRHKWAILIAASLVLLLSLVGALSYVPSSIRVTSTPPLVTASKNPSLASTPMSSTPMPMSGSTHAATSTPTSTAKSNLTPTTAPTSTPASTQTPTQAPIATPTPPIPLLTDPLKVPFTDGTSGVSTQNSYSGTVQVTVSGTGQAATTQWSDAFYIYTDASGNPISPDHASCWVLYINSQPTDTFISTPQYNSSHSYTFMMTAPGGTLSFGVCDNVTTDDTGFYTITVTQANRHL